MIDGETTDSWIKRARAEGTCDARPGAESDPLAQAFAEATSDGWDPWEVWLRHIEHPRRHLTERRAKTFT
jgi:hypothetical protein